MENSPCPHDCPIGGHPARRWTGSPSRTVLAYSGKPSASLLYQTTTEIAELDRIAANQKAAAIKMSKEKAGKPEPKIFFATDKVLCVIKKVMSMTEKVISVSGYSRFIREDGATGPVDGNRGG